MTVKTVLISGAGVAGPALAYWLHHHGFVPTVVERAPAPRPGGQGIDLRGTARTVVARMGVLEQVRARHTGVREMVQVDASGRPLFTFGSDTLGDSGGIIADLEILRGDLVDVLLEATRADVEYVFDDSIESLSQDGHGVSVTFARSAPRRFDLVVGADGTRSTVRRLAFGPHERFLTDGGYHLSVFSTPRLTDLRGRELMLNLPAGSGVGGRMAGLYPTADPDVARGMLFYASRPQPHDRRDVSAQKRLVANAFRDAGWLVPRMVDAMRESADFYFARTSRVHVDVWSRGRVALLGDSVFGGSVGMGTSMAIVGAYVLAGELAAAEGPERAFAAYQQRMAEYVRRCCRPMPGGTKGMLPATRFGLRVRNAGTRLMLAGPWRHAVTGGLQKVANSITLPDYAPA